MPESQRTASQPRGARGEARRREILEAAERIFARDGYSAATTEAIAREVGLSQPAIFRYFPNKKQLFLEALALRQGTLLEHYREVHARPIPAFEKLRAVGQMLVDLSAKHPEMGRLRLQAAAAHADPDIRQAVLDGLRALVGAHEALLRAAQEEGDLRDGVDPQTAACTMTGLAFLYYLASSVGFELASTPETASAFAARFLDGIAAG